MAGSDRVAAGHVLDDSLVEALSRTALNGGDDAHAKASGKVVLGGPAEASGQEGVEAGRGGVIAEQALGYLHEHGLAVRAAAVQHSKVVLICAPGKQVAEEPVDGVLPGRVSCE